MFTATSTGTDGDQRLNSALSNLTAEGYSRAMNRSGSQAATTRPDPHDNDAFGQVLSFRRPGRPPPLIRPARPARSHLEQPGIAPPDDLAQYEQDQDEVVDYRQRMLMNVIALAVVAFLVSTGVWLADTIAEMERDQDCVMQGRVNCAPIGLPAPPQQ